MNDEALVKLRAAKESSLCIFAQDLLGAALSPWQRELLVEVVSNPQGAHVHLERTAPRDTEHLDRLVAAAIERSPIFKELRQLLDAAVLNSKPIRIVAQQVTREEFLRAADARADGVLHTPKSVAQMKSEAGTMTHPGGKLPVDCPAMAASVCAASGLLGALQNPPIYEVAIDPAVPNGDQSAMRIVSGVPAHEGEVSVKLNRHPAPQGINKVR